MALDIAYPIRKGMSDWNDEELRYSLRSVNDNVYRRLGRVFVFGHRPDFLGDVTHVPVEEHPEKSFDLMKKYRAMVDSDLSDPFLLLDDDHIFLEPWAEFPRHVQGRLETLMRRQWFLQKRRYGAYLANCLILLRRNGLPERNYQIHQPWLIQKDKLAQVCDMAEGVGTVMGSLYGNLVGGPAIERRLDYRANTFEMYVLLKDGAFMSTEEELTFASVLDGRLYIADIKRDLRRRFPDPSPWEVP